MTLPMTATTEGVVEGPGRTGLPRCGQELT